MNSELFKEKFENGDLNELVSNLKKYIEVNKEDSKSLLQLAKTYKKLNRLVDAVNIYITILEFEPKNQEAIYEKSVTQAIVNQSQLDIYSCINTHMDPWT